MQVLTWEKKRRILLKSLASIDESVAQRADSVHTAWQAVAEEQRLAAAPAAEQFETALKQEMGAGPEDILREPRAPEPDEPTQEQDNENEETAVTPPKRKTLAHYLD